MSRNRRSGMSRRRFLGAAGAGVAGLAGMAAGMGGVAHAVGPNVATPVYDRVTQSGVLRVGIHAGGSLFRFGTMTNPKGIEPEMARSLAKVLGVQIEWVPNGGGDDRFRAVSEHADTNFPDIACDVVFRSATHTIDRETGKNITDNKGTPDEVINEYASTFSPIYYLDGGDVLFHSAADATNPNVMIAAKTETTTLSSLQEVYPADRIHIIYKIDGGPSQDAQLQAAWEAGEAIASDATILKGWVKFGAITSSGTETFYSELGGGFLSQEALGAVLPESDALWYDIVSTVIWTYMIADNSYMDVKKIDGRPIAEFLGIRNLSRIILGQYVGYDDLLAKNGVVDPTGLNRVWTNNGVHVPPTA
jgi:hypothetical protein